MGPKPQTEPLRLGGVQETLLLPLWGRAVESRKTHPLLVDPTAVAIVAALPYDFGAMARNLSSTTLLSWVVRALHIDGTARAYLDLHPDGTIVNLGCGLDTTFERVDNGQVHWFDVDLPDVISLRRRFIRTGDRRCEIAASITDDAWKRKVEPGDSILFIAAGVLYYFREDEVKALISGLASAFPGAEMIFDACSPLARRTANSTVIAAGGMEARLQWGLRRAKDIETWDSRFAVIDSYPMFRGMRHGLGLRDKMGALLVDALNMMFMVRLRLGRATARDQ